MFLRYSIRLDIKYDDTFILTNVQGSQMFFQDGCAVESNQIRQNFLNVGIIGVFGLLKSPFDNNQFCIGNG